MLIDLESAATQGQLAMVVGVTQQNISALMGEGKLPKSGKLGFLLVEYCSRLRQQAAGRLGSQENGVALDLVQERAGLAREQRISQSLKNSVTRKEFAPIGALADVLSLASSAVVDRLDQVEGNLRKACPDLPEEARTTVLQVLAAARNEWIRSTASLVSSAVDEMQGDGEDEGLFDSSDINDGAEAGSVAA